MRIIISCLLLVFTLISVSSAELLTTANPIGQGKWAVLGSYLSDSNASNTSGYGNAIFGGYVGYGLNKKLDLYLNAGSLNVTGLPAGFSASVFSYALISKYALIQEGDSIPISVSAGVGYRILTYTQSAAFGGNMSGNQLIAGLGISKMMVPFIPYGGLVYRSTTAGGAAVGAQLDLTVGTAIAWSTQGAVFVEYTSQSITPNGGTAYASPQIGIGVGYLI